MPATSFQAPAVHSTAVQRYIYIYMFLKGMITQDKSLMMVTEATTAVVAVDVSNKSRS